MKKINEEQAEFLTLNIYFIFIYPLDIIQRHTE